MLRWGSTILLLLSGLACTPKPQEAPIDAVVVKDDLGRLVWVDKRPERVLSLAPSNTEWVFALGAGDRLVGRSSRCDHPPAALTVPDMGSLFPPDLERLALSRPDLVLMIDGLANVRSHFEQAGVPVLVLQPRTLVQMDDGVRRLAKVLGVDAAATLARRDRTQRKARKKTVIYLAGAAPAYAAGPQTFIADMIRQSGGQVLDLKLKGDWPQVPLERLALARPDLIIASDAKVAAAIKAGGPTWQAMQAKVLTPPDPDWFARPGPRVDEGLKWLTSALK